MIIELLNYYSLYQRWLSFALFFYIFNIYDCTSREL